MLPVVNVRAPPSLPCPTQNSVRFAQKFNAKLLQISFFHKTICTSHFKVFWLKSKSSNFQNVLKFCRKTQHCILTILQLKFFSLKRAFKQEKN